VSTILGGTGRLPTVKELLTIVDYSQSSPPLIDPIFGSIPNTSFWSSSPVAGTPTYAWNVSFGVGNIHSDVMTSNLYVVRCVR
jgi:hypothetical protein